MAQCCPPLFLATDNISPIPLQLDVAMYLTVPLSQTADWLLSLGGDRCVGATTPQAFALKGLCLVSREDCLYLSSLPALRPAGCTSAHHFQVLVCLCAFRDADLVLLVISARWRQRGRFPAERPAPWCPGVSQQRGNNLIDWESGCLEVPLPHVPTHTSIPAQVHGPGHLPSVAITKPEESICEDQERDSQDLSVRSVHVHIFHPKWHVIARYFGNNSSFSCFHSNGPH